MTSAQSDPLDYGYDPGPDAEIECPPPLTPDEVELPDSAMVTQDYLPPPGQQGSVQQPGAPGTCTAWASTYGLATFTLAKRTNTPPTSNDLIASPAWIYLQVRHQAGQPTPPCKGSSFRYYFGRLAKHGTPNLAKAPYFNNCSDLTSYYQTHHPEGDPRFHLGQVSPVQTSDLLALKQALANNCALAYGTRLYPGFDRYTGTPNPYTGSGPGSGAHCMLIIGYNDAYPDSNGAFYIQNSMGTGWGLNGRFWITYEAFQNLAQKVAFYYPD